jgi:putative membrane protein
LAQKPGAPDELIGGDIRTELAAQRTALAFERTAMASDRTLMAGVRTSFALIGFGFTIFQFFHTLNDRYLDGGITPGAPRRFGLTLVSLGIILLVIAIYNHYAEAKMRRVRRKQLFEAKLIRSAETPGVNSAQVIAILLLFTGLLAILRLAARVGPF